MIKNVVDLAFPTDENLYIRKNSISHGDGKKRICIVTGTHGDELEGQYVCYLLASLMRAQPEKLNGTIEIYNALNPLGIDSIRRGIPGFDLDMNRIFPGNPQGTMAETMAWKIVEDLKGADMVIDIHASNIFLREVPQARINVLTAPDLVPLARFLNLNFIWVHEAATVLKSTLAQSLNSTGTRCIVVEMGVGMRIHRTFGRDLVSGILNLMHHLGMWSDAPSAPIKQAILSQGDEVEFINAAASGVFVNEKDNGIVVEKGEPIGKIVDSLTGEILEDVCSPVHGYLFTIRAYPVVYEGSLIARIHKLPQKA